MNKKNYLWIIPIMVFVVCATQVLGAITFTAGPDDKSIVRSDTSYTVVSALRPTAYMNTTISILNSAGTTLASIKTAGNTSTMPIDYATMPSGTFTMHGVGDNGTTTEATTDRTFTITGCNNTSLALWGVVLLLFTVGLLYFAYTGFVEGNPAKLITFIIMLTIAVVIVANFSLSTLRAMC